MKEAWDILCSGLVPIDILKPGDTFRHFGEKFTLGQPVPLRLAGFQIVAYKHGARFGFQKGMLVFAIVNESNRERKRNEWNSK